MNNEWFQHALERSGVSQADLARHLRLAPSAVSRMLQGTRQMKLLEAVQIANLLGITQEDVLRHAGTEPAAADAPARPARRPGRPPTNRDRPAERPIMPAPDVGSRIPIRSAGRGGVDQEMFLEDGPIGHTARPSNLTGVREAYAIYMTGDSMEPRYEPGWLLHVNPFKPPVRGRDVVVYKRNRAVLIKQFLGWEQDRLMLGQLNPRETFSVPRDEVIDCHLIVGADQEG